MQLNLSGPSTGPAAVVLPVTALVKGSGSAGVWVLDAKGSRLVFQPVQVVDMGDASVHVTGLTAGSRVVSVGAQKLDAGITVRAIERAPEAEPARVVKSSS